MPAPMHPGIYVEELPSGVPPIAGVATAIALFVGWAPRGPVDRAVRMTSFADFARSHGGIDARSLLGYAVGHFYDNGGGDTYVLRIAGDDAATAAADLGDLHVAASSPGGWAADYAVRATRPAGDDTRFTLDVIRPASGDAAVERFADLSMTPGDPRFAPSIVNGGSRYLAGLVANTTITPADGTVALGAGTPGDDGAVIGPDAAAFRQAVTDAFEAGGIADRIDLFNLLVVPGLTDAATLAMLQRRAHDRRAFLIADAGPDETVATVGGAAAALAGADARDAALYFPWVRAPDPLRADAVRAFPPSGFVAGVYARTDRARGVWQAPSGTEAGLTGAAGLAIAMTDAENGALNRRAINCLRTLPGHGAVVWGARTLDGDDSRGSEWKYVPVRRLALFIEESVSRGTAWAAFEANDARLWARIRLTAGAFLQALFRQGAFRASTPREAYFVRCDQETTTRADIDLGVVNIMIGFAPLKPAEFVVLKIRRAAGQVPA